MGDVSTGNRKKSLGKDHGNISCPFLLTILIPGVKVFTTKDSEEKSRLLKLTKRVRKVKADRDRELKCISESGGPKQQ